MNWFCKELHRLYILEVVCVSIIVLTLLDVIATGIGVSVGLIEEGNPLINYLFSFSIPATCFLAFLVTTVLLWLVYTVQVKHDLAWISYALYGILFIKSIVAITHFTWFIGSFILL